MSMTCPCWLLSGLFWTSESASYGLKESVRGVGSIADNRQGTWHDGSSQRFTGKGLPMSKTALMASNDGRLVAETTLELVQDALAMTRKARRLQAQVEAINRRRREIIAALIGAGLRQQEVARLLDISRQRVTQYVDELRAEGLLPPAGDEDDDRRRLLNRSPGC